MKKCSRCKTVKDYSNFPKDAGRKDGYGYVCKACQSILRHKHYIENRDKELQQQAEYRDKNRDYWIAWAQKHKSQRATRERNRRALKSTTGIHTLNDIADILEYQQGCCAYCGGVLSAYHVDHVVPLIKGGSNTAENLVIACPACNLSKHDLDYQEWMQLKGLNVHIFETRFHNRVLR